MTAQPNKAGKGISLFSKLLVLIGLLSAVCLGVGLLGVSSIQQMSAKLNDVHETGQEATLGSRINSTSIRISRAEARLGLDLSAAGQAATLKEIDDQRKIFEERMAALRKTADTQQLTMLDESQRLYAAYLEKLAKTIAQSKQVAQSSHEDQGMQELNLRLAESSKAGLALEASLRQYLTSMDKLAGQTSDEAIAKAQTIRDSMLAIALLGTVIGLLMGGLLGHFGIAKPIHAIVQVMGRLSGGELSAAIPGSNRGDELGEMAQALAVFRDGLVEVGRLQEAQKESQRRAEEDRRQTLQQLADSFDAQVRAEVSSVATSTAEITETANEMAGRSERSGSRSVDVAEAAIITTQRAEGASEATRQLAAAVNEISQQVNKSSAIAQRAVDDVNATSQQMTGLNGSVQAIGEVVALINDIAAQTNLLALNATIEAARAGEAGKGFAVVANEVKNLANQTARATDDIARQVAAVQDSTKAMGLRIEEVVETIRSLDTVATTIAGAVSQQEAATREIARDIDDVAEQANLVSQNVGSLSKSAARSCAGTVRVIWSAQDLEQAVDNLRREAEKFVQAIRP